MEKKTIDDFIKDGKKPYHLITNYQDGSRLCEKVKKKLRELRRINGVTDWENDNGKQLLTHKWGSL